MRHAMPATVLTRPRKFTGCEMQSGELYELGAGTAAVFSTRAPGKQGPNEDAAALIPAGEGAAVLVVADGVGGQPDGAGASAVAIDTLIRFIGSGVPDAGDLRDAILSAAEETNRWLIDAGTASATTLAAVEIHGDGIRPYHVGDSMILVSGGHGKVKLETVSHSPVGYALESGLLSEDEAIVHEERHLVSNVVGSRDMHISVGIRTRLAARDTLLIATDGLFDNLHKDEIVELMRKGPLERCAGNLARFAGRRMAGSAQPNKPDDLTFILFRPAHTRRRGA
jgi:serine/threonine protein phosphatase PrpC